MKKKIFRWMCLLALAAALLSSVLIFFSIYRSFYANTKELVRAEAGYIKTAMEFSGRPYLDALAAKPASERLFRITLISPSGTVLSESEKPADQLENHLSRPEVQAALQTGSGEATRLSATMREQTYYFAVRLDDGSVLRVAATTHSVLTSFLEYLPFSILILSAVAVFSVFLSGRLTKYIIRPINSLDLNNPLRNETYDELSPLLSRLAKQNNKIQEQMDLLRQNRAEFSAITENMNEGLILLSFDGAVLSINKSALRFFDVRLEYPIGAHIFSINRSLELRRLMEHIEMDSPGEAYLSQHGRRLQLLATRVPAFRSEGGIVLLILDVTERYEAEQMRREFSANVSHELKTPLQSISGYAEIMKNGLVKQEDIPDFTARIHKEACSQISLVDDIIKLSPWDESQRDLNW